MNNRSIAFLIVAGVLVSGAILFAANYDNENGIGTGKNGEITRDEADVETIQVTVQKTPTQQVTVTAQGNLPDSCTRISDVSQERDDDTFEITIETERQASAMCAQVLTPFLRSITLEDVDDLEPGKTYTVDVNGVLKIFSMDDATSPPTTPLTTPPSQNSPLTMADQRPGSVVEVPRIILPAKGYIVIHENVNGNAGAVVGKTPLLEAGTKADTKITLSRAAKIGDIFIVMLHTDNNDAVFSEANDPEVPGSRISFSIRNDATLPK